MFQRQARSTFPVRTMILMGAAILAIAYLLFKNSQKPEKQEGIQIEPTGRLEMEEGGKGPQSSKPFEDFWLARAYPDFNPDIDAYKAALADAMSSTAARDLPVPGAAAPWTVEGPGNIGARINTIKVHPTDSNTIYIGYSVGGVWKTTNGGQTWAPIFDSQSELSISDIELDPQNPNHVWVGTGDLNVSGNVFTGNGIWRSTDGGQNWQNMGLEDQRIVAEIQFHPTNSNIMYAATMGNPFQRGGQRGLYKTTNGGQTWERVFFIDNQTGTPCVALTPSNPDVIYVSTWPRIRTNSESYVSGPTAGVFKSTDGGQNWIQLTNGLPTGRLSRVGIEIDPTNENRLIAIVVDSTLQHRGIYETKDAGQSWVELVENGLDPGFMGGFGWYFGKVYINTFKPGDIYAGGVQLWRYRSNVGSWEQATPDWWTYEVHADMHDMAFISKNHILLATDGGLYRTEDGGQLWEKIENNPCTQFYRVAWNPHEPDLYYGGAQDNGTTGGNASLINDWPRFYGGDGFQAAFHPDFANIRYYETQDGGIVYFDTDNFDVQAGDEGIEQGDRRNWDMPYFISKHNADLMYTGSQRVYISDTHPPLWIPISDDLTDGDILGGRFNTISNIDESPIQAGLLYVGTSDGNVWQGDATSLEWNNITGSLPDRYVTGVHASPTNVNRVFVTHTGYRDNENTPHIHRSDNKGQSWTPITGDMPQLAINALYIVPNTNDQVLIAGTDGGVYATLNGGAHWFRMGAGMPWVPVMDISYNAFEDKIFVGTFARGIYSFPLGSLVSTNAPTNQAQVAIFPSLLARGQSITCQPPANMTGTAMLHIYNAAGKVVQQQQLELGNGPARVNLPDQCPPGIYFASIKSANRQLAARKLVVRG